MNLSRNTSRSHTPSLVRTRRGVGQKTNLFAGFLKKLYAILSGKPAKSIFGRLYTTALFYIAIIVGLFVPSWHQSDHFTYIIQLISAKKKVKNKRVYLYTWEF